MRHAAVNPALSTAHSPPTLAVQADVHDAVLDLHVAAQVSLEVELAGAVRALEWLAACVQVHVAQQVVHAVEGLPAHLEQGGYQGAVGSPSWPIYPHHTQHTVPSSAQPPAVAVPQPPSPLSVAQRYSLSSFKPPIPASLHPKPSRPRQAPAIPCT